MKNKHRVNKDKWRKWSEEARRVFNEVYGYMVANQDLFLHRDDKIPAIEKHWKVTAHNSAWIAADSVDKRL